MVSYISKGNMLYKRKLWFLNSFHLTVLKAAKYILSFFHNLWCVQFPTEIIADVNSQFTLRTLVSYLWRELENSGFFGPKIKNWTLTNVSINKVGPKFELPIIEPALQLCKVCLTAESMSNTKVGGYWVVSLPKTKIVSLLPIMRLYPLE